MKPYADSNFFTRLYLDLPGTEEAIALLEIAQGSAAAALPATWLHRIEVVNALQLHLFGSRAHAQTVVTPEQAAIAQAKFREDLIGAEFLRIATPSPDELRITFEDLSLRFSARHGFRSYDILHVASALLLGCDTFWSFDVKACRLAGLEGMKLAKR